MRRLLAALACAFLAQQLSGCAEKSAVAIEYVTVKFPADRVVYVDSQPNGRTNQVIRVDRGTHQFHLGPDADYEPASQTVLVKDGSALSPQVVEFRRKGGP